MQKKNFLINSALKGSKRGKNVHFCTYFASA